MTPANRTARPHDWRAHNPVPAYGALRRGVTDLGLSANGLYGALRRGNVIVDPNTHEFVRVIAAPAKQEPKSAPAVRDRRAAILGDVEKYIADLSAVDPTTGQEFGHALVNLVQRVLASQRTEVAIGKSSIAHRPPDPAPLELHPMLPTNPVLGAFRGAWDRHVTSWLATADRLANDMSAHPGGWSLSRDDVLHYLRGRLDALAEEGP